MSPRGGFGGGGTPVPMGAGPGGHDASREQAHSRARTELIPPTRGGEELYPTRDGEYTVAPYIKK